MSEPLSLAAPMPIPSDGFWARLAHTPMRDALRGHLNARLDARRVIAAAELPEPLAGLTWLVVRRTRLHREEKLEVARELAGHFRDGLEAGRSVADLARAFGDPVSAARLIRRAKLRARPWRQRAARRMLQAVGLLSALLVVAYLGLALRFAISRPTISRDYVKELNAAPRAVPEADRAWPLYRQALLEFKKPTTELRLTGLSTKALPSKGDPVWEGMLVHARDNPSPLRLTREAAARPRLGFIHGDPADATWLRKALKRDSLPPDASDRPLFSLILPHIQELGNLRMLLWADAGRALAEGDRASLLADVRALLGLANQLHEPRTFLVVDLTALANLDLAAQIVGEALDQRAELFTDSDLRTLAHEFGTFAGGGPLHMRLDGERMLFHDLIQRMYTDNGSGDGYLTADGLRLLRDLGGVTLSLRNESFQSGDDPIANVVGPGLTVAIAGRREMIALADRLYDQMEREQSQPMWTWDGSQSEDELHSLRASKATAIRYLPVFMIMPSVQSVSRNGEYVTQRRDALLAALAMTLFHHREGTWPATLHELIPGLLPSVPIDRWSGQPLSYRVIEGRPLLYSTGPNRVDDAGKNARQDEIRRTGEPPSAQPNLPGAADDLILWPAR